MKHVHWVQIQKSLRCRILERRNYNNKLASTLSLCRTRSLYLPFANPLPAPSSRCPIPNPAPHPPWVDGVVGDGRGTVGEGKERDGRWRKPFGGLDCQEV